MLPGRVGEYLYTQHSSFVMMCPVSAICHPRVFHLQAGQSPRDGHEPTLTPSVKLSHPHAGANMMKCLIIYDYDHNCLLLCLCPYTNAPFEVCVSPGILFLDYLPVYILMMGSRKKAI